jgi:hypothetical protein
VKKRVMLLGRARCKHNSRQCCWDTLLFSGGSKRLYGHDGKPLILPGFDQNSTKELAKSNEKSIINETGDVALVFAVNMASGSMAS